MPKKTPPPAIVKMARTREAIGRVAAQSKAWCKAYDAWKPNRMLAAGVLLGEAIEEAQRAIEEITNEAEDKTAVH